MTPDLPPSNDSPLAVGEIGPTIIMFCVAAAGGAINWWAKVRAGETRPFNIMELVGELVVSGIVGIFTYWALKGFGINPFLVAAGVGISGHMGTRVLFLVEKIIEQKLRGKRA